MQLKNIHPIRGIAALIVVIYHAKWALWCGGAEYLSKFGLHSITDYLLFGLDMLSSCGTQCVIIFFLLSAVVITHTYRQNPSLPLFFKIRAVRIYLPYLASMAFSAAALILCAGYLIPKVCFAREYTSDLLVAYREMSWAGFFKSLIFLPRQFYWGFNQVYWSLLQEGIFYLVFPFYFRLSVRQLVLAGLTMLILSFLLSSNILYYQACFIIGMLAYHIIYLKNISLPTRNSLLTAGIIVLYVLMNLFVKKGWKYPADFSAIIIFILLLSCLLKANFMMPALLKRLSDQSYSLYLFHFPVLMLYFAFLSKITAKCVFYSRLPYYSGVVLALLVNIPLYYLFEYQSLKIINKLKARHRFTPEKGG